MGLITASHAFNQCGIFRLAFGIPKCDHKMLLSKLVAFICEKNHPEVVTKSLLLLHDINKDYPDEIQNNSLQILVN